MTIKKTVLILVILTGIILLFLPANLFDNGQSICVSVLLFDKQCYGCGMTRAIQHLIHFEFEKAYDFNKLSFIVLPLSLFMIGTEIKKTFFTTKKKID